MKVFFSYGHDIHADFIKKIKKDLNKKENIDIWLDSEELKAKDDWELELEHAIENSDEIVYFITPYSARRPDGYCLNELAFSIINGKKIIPVMVDFITPPLSICRIQYIDIQHLRTNFNKKEYIKFIDNLYDVLTHNKELSNEGDHFNLLSLLTPIDFSIDFKKHLANYIGRKWLFEKTHELLNENIHSVIWIKAEAGFGKTAFSTMLQHISENAVGIHYCQFDSVKRKSTLSIIKTFIFQLMTQLSEYKEILNTLNLNDIHTKNESEIIEHFLVEPLNKIEIDKHYFFIIDAIDEAIENGTNKVVDLILKFRELPSWLKIVITSRPEPYLNRKLSKLKTIEINTSTQENKQDLLLYLDSFSNYKLCSIFQSREIREKILKNSEGNILYLKEIIESVLQGQIDQNDILQMPKGMDALYLNMFERYFKDTRSYKLKQRPLFELISSINKKMSLSFISLVLELDEYDLEEILEPVGALIEMKDDTIKFFHKSISDWVTNRNKSGKDYYISKTRGNQRIVDLLLTKEIKFIKKLSRNFDDILIIFNAFYTVAYQKLNEEDTIVEEIYKKIIQIKEQLFDNQSFKQVLEKNDIDGQLDFILHLAYLDYEISQSLVVENPQYTKNYILAAKNYAYMLKELGNTKESLNIQKYIVKFVKKLYKNGNLVLDYEYAELLNILAQTYSSIGEIKKAIKKDKAALKIVEKNYTSGDKNWTKLYTNSLNSLAVSYGNFDKIHRAVTLEEKVKSIIMPFYKRNKDEWISYYIKALNNLAISYKDIGEMTQSILLEEELFSIIKPLYNKNKIQWINDYALILNNLAFTYKTIGKIDESIVLEEKALSLTEAQYKINKGYWTHLYIKSLLNLALSYKNTWLVTSAISLEKKVIELTKSLYKQDKLRWSDVYTRSLTSLAISLSKVEDYTEALLLEEESLSIRKGLFEKNPQRWVDAFTLSMNNSAFTFIKLGSLKKAKLLFSKNLKIREVFYNNTPDRWADHYTESLINLSFIFLFQKKYMQAIKLQKKSFEIKKKLYMKNPEHWAESFSRNLAVYGASYYKLKKFKKAIFYEEQAFSINQTLFKQHKTRWAYNYLVSLSSLSISYASNGMQEKAVSLQKLFSTIKFEEKELFLLSNWINENFSLFLSIDYNNTSKKELIKIKEKLLHLEFMQKKSPHRWSDAFK